MKSEIIVFTMVLNSICAGLAAAENEENEPVPGQFEFISEQFADIRILRYQIPEFELLTAKQKELVYYLSQAALCGRDILWDQNGKYNLLIRNVLETIYKTYKGNRESDDFKNFVVYLKRVWFSNGIHHHYSTDKIMPSFSQAYFSELFNNSDFQKLSQKTSLSAMQIFERVQPVIFDPHLYAKRVFTDPSKDLLLHSANNLYVGVTESEAHEFYDKMKQPGDIKPLSYGLNSQLVKENGQLTEKVYKSGGKYGEAIDEIIKWLEKAETVAENEAQKRTIQKLVAYYKTGDLKLWDDYNIEWVSDTSSHVDFINGFIEVYGDPIGLKASWESVVNFKNIEASRRATILSNNAQWFENQSPVEERFKKEQVKGISAKVITVAQLGGDCHQATPIGINLPNADWIRREHGSKSVTIENITYAYDQAAQNSGMLQEFASGNEEIELIKKYGFISSNIHVDLHECLGHGSGKLMPGIGSEALKNYHSVIEETRADLFALYYIADPKMVELGLLPDADAYKAEYYHFMRNGLLTQLVRIAPGNNLEEAHMRNRQLIAAWCYENGKNDNVLRLVKTNGKTYLKINYFNKLRSLIARLLAEVQRIKSEGDYNAAKNLVENYAVVVNKELHTEILERYAKLNLAPYNGFINPVLKPVVQNNKMVDIIVEYPNDFSAQMLEYSEKYSFLPVN